MVQAAIAEGPSDQVVDQQRAHSLQHALSLSNQGFQALNAGDFFNAIASFNAALELEPALPNAREGRFNAAWQRIRQTIDACNWVEFDNLQHLLREGMLQGMYFLGETALASPWLDNELLLSGSRAFWTARTPQTSGVQPALPKTTHFARQPGRLRVGFVGADFFSQATAYLLIGVIEGMDREQFETFAYDCEPLAPGTHDPLNERCKSAYEHFTTIDHLSDFEAAERIRSDDIDILINLRGVGNGRMGIFALRPCSIQIQYLYFPGTTGASFMDYFVSDEIATPPELEYSFSEKILRLPGCYQPKDQHRVVPENLSRSDFGIPPDAIVMANFSQSYKLTPYVFNVWCDLLRADDRRILWLLANDDAVIQNLQREATARGIDSNRLVFSRRANVSVHLARIRAADLILDTFPYGGHTLTSDALWVGTPVVTQVGSTFASRVPYSLLSATGLGALACTDLASYGVLADSLLRQPAELKRLRDHLESNRYHFDLFNSALYAQRFGDMLLSLM